ncbi:helix-turn-helix domain-containing protein [Glaciimonas sp. PCH181]|uniref:helix-turn-helix domain-containing protein n=1 Tax=Glaciimonas sp. PCH181 TaxID=2133943 RepID=UPI001374B305|nr:helix-turn-helix domain-containing protein [Glaciimonas sp. PCH181]
MSEPQEFIAKPLAEEALSHSEHAAEHVHSVGEQLAHRRQQHGWSIDDVANQLKLAPRQIHAIETDNYAALPTIVMTRGYIRSYAKMLGLDPATILPSAVPVSAARIHASEAQSRATIFAESRLLLSGRNRVPYKWIFGGILFVVVVVIVAQLGGFSALRQPSAEIGSPHAASVAEGETLSASSVPAVSAANSDASSTAFAAHAAETVNAKPQPAVVDAVVPAAGANKLSLTFKQDSWVEIKRADKSTLFSRVGKAGSTETFDIDQPVSVVIGNLSGVEATLRGAPLDLKAGTKNNIARLNLK